MAAKSDLAQKLLHDLCLRKEQMAAAQSSSPNSNQLARASCQGNSVKTSYRGAKHINGLQVSSKTGNSHRSSGGSESSNQIFLYNKGHQSSSQMRDLSMAIAFAFENVGKLSKIGTSKRDPLVNFFNRFTRGSIDSEKMDIANLNKYSFSADQFSTVSHIQIFEIAKGVQQLNEVLRACFNRHDFDRNTTEFGKKLLKGAIHLEESLRILVNMQNGTQYNNGAGTKNRIRLLEEDEEDQDGTNKEVNQMQLVRPRFSFDKTSTYLHAAQRRTKSTTKHEPLQLLCQDETFKGTASNSKTAPHKSSATCVTEFNSHSTQVKLKGRISNVVAKLMGLEELAQKDDFKGIKKEQPSNREDGKERMYGKVSSKDSEHGKNGSLSFDKNAIRTSNIISIRTKIFEHGDENSQGVVGDFKKENAERKQLPGKLKTQVGLSALSKPNLGTFRMNKQENQISLPNIVGFQNLKDQERKQHLPEHGERKILEAKESKEGNGVLHQKAKQNSIIPTLKDVTHENLEFKISAEHGRKMDANKDPLSKQRKPTEKSSSLQMQVFKTAESLDNKYQAVQNGKQYLKQNLIARTRKGHQVEFIISPKTMPSAENVQKKKPQNKNTAGNGNSAKVAENYSMKHRAHNGYQKYTPMNDSADTAPKQDDIEEQGKIQNTSPCEPKSKQVKISDCIAFPPQECPKDVPATQVANSPEIQVSTEHDETVNQLRKSPSGTDNMMQDWKPEAQNKDNSCKELKQYTDGQTKEAKAGFTIHNSSKLETEPSKRQEESKTDPKQLTVPRISVGNECQTQAIQDMLALNDNGGDDMTSKSGNVFNDLHEMQHQPDCSKDRKVPKLCDQKTGGHRQSIVCDTLFQHKHNQIHTSKRQEPLTENENDLKEIVIKSQMFLKTAEALFKFNITPSFLHAGDQTNEAADKKLMIDCGCEVMKRKARRHQILNLPHTNTSASLINVISLDDLVKQLCEDFEMLKFHGGNGRSESSVENHLHKMIDKDMHNDNPDVNSMWDFEWNNMTFMFPPKDDIIRDVEKHLLNGLLNEITNDLSFVPSLA